MKSIWVALLALACGSCNHPTYSNCLGGSGRILGKHPVVVHNAWMTFIQGSAYVEDDANRGFYKVAQFGEQPQRLLYKIDEEAAHRDFPTYKSRVSLEGYEFTCARCGDHFIVVNAMTASEPSEFTNADLLAQQRRMMPFPKSGKKSRECEIPLS